MAVSSFFCIFAPNPLICIRGSFTDSCGIANSNPFIIMNVETIEFVPSQIDETNTPIEMDKNGFIWVYTGKEHGYDSWYGIPPEFL